VFVYYGSDSGLGTSPSWQIEQTSKTPIRIGHGHPGDYNNDGYDDLPVGAFGINTAYVYYGRALIGSLSAETTLRLNWARSPISLLLSLAVMGDRSATSGILGMVNQPAAPRCSTPTQCRAPFIARVTADNSISHVHAETTATVFEPFALTPGSILQLATGCSPSSPFGLSSSLLSHTPPDHAHPLQRRIPVCRANIWFDCY